MTDYAPHNTWIKPNVDEYCVACEDMIADMVSRGVKEEKYIRIWHLSFCRFFNRDERDKEVLLKELGLSKDKMTVLVMAGSFWSIQYRKNI